MAYSTTKDTKSAKESENETLDSIFQSGVGYLVNLDVAARHAIGKVIEFQLRVLRVLRGGPHPVFVAEHSFRTKALLSGEEEEQLWQE